MMTIHERLWKVGGVMIMAAVLTLGSGVPALAQVAVDPDLHAYKRGGGVAGNLNSIGSDTLNNLMTLWAEGFRAIYPNVHIQIEGKGSSTAPPALIEGTAQLGPMSRPMKSKERDRFEKRYGYKPTAIRVAIDALAVFVHKNNPLTGLTLAQVDSIFSSTYKRGAKPARTWGDVGLKGAWASRPMSLYGRNSASGTYGMFKNIALQKGDYKTTVKEQPGSSSVVQGVASDLGGIGYSGIGYQTSGVKALALGDRSTLYAPSLDNSLAGDYPLARFLYIYVNQQPNESLDKLTLEFVKFILSREGQEVVIKDGYYPLPAVVATEAIGP
ncbi:Phosphate-binding protein PstS [Candidatus Entotheonellaceae bacterium PAL068K]